MATIGFNKAADRDAAIRNVATADPDARVFLPEASGGVTPNYIEFELTARLNESLRTFVDAANEQGRGPFSYQVCVPA